MLYSPKETPQIAQQLLNLLQKEKKNILALQGNLGSGKTTLAQNIGRLLGVKETINSPTFVFFKTYPASHRKFRIFCHLDAYRLKSPQELKPLGIEDFFYNPHALCLIEWPEKISSLLPQQQTLFIKITIPSSLEKRKLTIIKQLPGKPLLKK